jgi:hypothetical protein
MITFYCLKFEAPQTWKARLPYLYPPVISPCIGFPFRRLLRLAEEGEVSNPPSDLATPWPESASELYRPSDRRLLAKLVPTFAASVTDPYGRILALVIYTQHASHRNRLLRYCVSSSRAICVSTKLFPSNGCCTVACLHIRYVAWVHMSHYITQK